MLELTVYMVLPSEGSDSNETLKSGGEERVDWRTAHCIHTEGLS